MPSAFHGIDLASRALRTFQRGLDVSGHNIANVNTAGYSRQAIGFTQTDPMLVYGSRAYSLGTGVTVATVNRVRDMFLEGRRSVEQSEFGRTSTMAQSLQRMESVMPMGAGGVNEALDRFFNSWSAFGANPNQPGLRQEVQQAGLVLSSRIRGTYADLRQLESQLEAAAGQTMRDIGALGERIADLNSQIRARQATGDIPNDLLDMRDAAVQQLSELVDIRTMPNSDGSIGVFINQFTLVDASGARPMPTSFDPAGQTFGTDVKAEVRSGTLLGLMQGIVAARDTMGQLDRLANTLRAEINALHASGINSNGTSGIDFFNGPNPPSGAIDFDLSAAVRADAGNIASGTSGAAGDGGLALTLSRLREEPIDGLGGLTFGSFYSDLLGKVGRDTAYFRSARDTQSAVLEQIDLQIQSVSGVSIDDEMANMLRFQRSFQAAAKALTVFDQMTEDLIGMLRR